VDPHRGGAKPQREGWELLRPEVLLATEEVCPAAFGEFLSGLLHQAVVVRVAPTGVVAALEAVGLRRDLGGVPEEEAVLLWGQDPRE